MTELRISDTEGALRIGEGPNSAELKAGKDRWQLNSTVGVASRFAFGTSRIYLGAGLGLDAGARYKDESKVVEPATSNASSEYSPRISARTLNKLGRELHLKTNSSDDLNQLRVVDMLGILTNPEYRAIMRREQSDALQATLLDVNKTLNNIDTVRQYLHDNPDLGAARYPELKAALAQPLSFNSFNQLTIHDLRRAIGQIDDKNGAESIISQTNAALAELDQMMGSDAPNKRLSKAQMNSVREAMEKLGPQLKQLNLQLENLPSVEAVRDAYETVEHINQLDPKLSVRAQAAAAVSFQPLRLGAHKPLTPVAGVSYARGVGADVDNVFAERRDNGEGAFHVAIHPSQLRSQTVAVGISSGGPYQALPGELARALGMLPSEESSGVGAHLAVTRTRETLLGVTATSTRAALAASYQQRIEDGFLLVEAGVDCPIKPSDTPKGCESTLRLGRRF